MTRYVALLRAVNVGGTGKLPMAELRRLCTAAGLADVRTHIASGNAVFSSGLGPGPVREALEELLAEHVGRPVGVHLRDAAEMARILAENPFADRNPTFTHAIFLDVPPPGDALAAARGVRDEEMRLGRREIYVHYPSGSGGSKLVIPAAAAGTARNMNTVAKLTAMLADA